MKARVIFKQINRDFSPEFAEANNNGQPSENNPLYSWEDEVMSAQEAISHELIESGTITLAGQRGENETFEFEIADMRLVTAEQADGTPFTVGVSNSILEGVQEDIDNLTYTFILQEDAVLLSPYTGLYIDMASVPEELKK